LDCERIRERITAHLDGTLSTEEAETVATHLASCPACASDAEALKNTLGLLEAWDLPVDSDPAFASDLADRVLAANAARPDRRFSLRLWVAAGVAGAVLGFLTTLFLEAGRPAPEPAPPELVLEDLQLHPLDLTPLTGLEPGEEK
jgi:anti-sigma factor RsiW